jgi:phosphatidylglycerol lysyltransferase
MIDAGWIGAGAAVAIAVLNGVTWILARLGDSLCARAVDFVEVEGIRLRYVQRGSGPAVVFLHGSDGFAEDFTESVLPLLEGEACCIAFDRPGHGCSEIPALCDMTLDAHARMIHSALHRLGIRRPILVGHSWGAALAATMAAQRPDEVAGLVFVAGYLYPGAKATPRLLRIPLRILLAVPRIPVLGPLLVSTLTPLLKPVIMGLGLRLAFWPQRPPTDYAHYARALWIRTPRRIHGLAVENATDAPLLGQVASCYERLAIPVFAVAGDRDQILPPEAHTLRFADNVPAARVTVVPNAGHQLTITHAAMVAEQIRACLAVASSGTSTESCVLSDYERARELVYRYGWNSTAYQILNPGMSHWFAEGGEAAVGFVTRWGVRIAAGAPVCAEERLAEVAVEFEADAERAGERVCWFGAAERLWEPLDEDGGHSRILVGAQPVWKADRWPEIVSRNSSLRAQLNRGRNKGVTVDEWDRDRAARSEDLRRVLDEWMETRAMPKLGFLTEPVSPDRLADRRVFVASRDGRPVAFLVCAPIPRREGWMIEQIARSSGAPNGSAEMLVDRAMDSLSREGADIVTLGLAPLSTRVETPPTDAAPLVRLLLLWVRAHGRRFYNFEGLDAFKAKFRPDYWEPIYAISNEPRVSVRTLYAIAAAFSEGPPLGFIWKAVVAAAAQEWTWLKRRREAGKKGIGGKG